MTQTLTQRLDEINALMLAGDATDEQVNEALRLLDLADAAPDLLESLSMILDPNNGAIGKIPSWLECKLRHAASMARGAL